MSEHSGYVSVSMLIGVIYMELFRYRNFTRGLQEIQEQTIYFASREELNDPTVEGFLNVFWQGDRIAWEGLFRNYVCSLYNVINLYLLKAEHELIMKSAVMVDIHQFDNVPAGKIIERLGDIFLESDDVEYLVSILSEGKFRISRDELLFFLYCIHRRALLKVFSVSIEAGYREESFIKIRDALVASLEVKKIPEVKNLLNKDIDMRQKILHEFCNLQEDHYNKIVATVMDTQKTIWMSIAGNFPNMYINFLENLLHPETYIACFSSSENNNAMWGQYASNHTGVCLIYDTHTQNGNECLALRKRYGVSSSGEEYYKYTDERIYPIQYGGSVCEANFFTTLGQFNGNILHGWLASKDGKRSCCLNHIYEQKDTWRNEYWQLLYNRYCHKTKEWEYEREYRLLLVNSFFDYTKKESRIIKYHFSDLKGVILGSKMLPKNRMMIVDAVEQQCKKHGREDFKIYIAEYDHTIDSIIKRPLYI